jgi:hypothetical protein
VKKIWEAGKRPYEMGERIFFLLLDQDIHGVT